MQVVEQEEQALLWDAGARQEQEQEQERNSFASGHKPSPLQCLVSASLPCFMILYDTLGIYVRLEVLGHSAPLFDNPCPFILCFWRGSDFIVISIYYRHLQFVSI